MIELILKSKKPATRIGVSNIKYEMERSNIAKFGNNVKDLLGDMSSNESIINDKGEIQDDYVTQIFRDLLSAPNSTFNGFTESTKADQDTSAEVLEGYLINNANDKYNSMVSAKEWTKTDPKDPKILTLPTCLSRLDKTKLLKFKKFK